MSRRRTSRHTLTAPIHQSQVVLRLTVTFHCRTMIPTSSLPEIFADVFSGGQFRGEKVLSANIALFSGPPNPLEPFTIRSEIPEQNNTKFHLKFRLATACRRPKPSQRFLVFLTS